ncbi:hypothetical protein ACOMHN_034223 [Nucella lapillus]
MPRSFLVKKRVKAEESGYHSYRVRQTSTTTSSSYDAEVLDISLKALTPYTPWTPPYTPPPLPPSALVVFSSPQHVTSMGSDGS